MLLNFSNLFINLITIIKALAVGLWFFATGRLFNKIFSTQNWDSIIIPMIISLLILSLDDGKLTELHHLKDTTVSAAMTIFQQQPDDPNK